MTLRRDLLLAMGILVGISSVVSFGAIGLFARMSPAIEKILQENVVSIEASEEMLVVLAKVRAEPLTSSDQEAFEKALGRARDNVTEESELPVILRIEGHWRNALEGNLRNLNLVVDEIRTLSAVNRQAMETSNRQARRLGEAGGWAAVLIALVALAIGVITIRKTDQRILRVFAELHEVLKADRRGDHLRRCQIPYTSNELREILLNVNGLLDERAQTRHSSSTEESRSS